jgi:2,3,4,5-tetrahydropyridine-2-carboxylate N-succinyltransferase
MDMLHLKEKIEAVWDAKGACDPETLELVLAGLDQGTLRVAEPLEGEWHVHAWIKKAILLYFKQTSCQVFGEPSAPFYDKMPLKCAGWTAPDFEAHGFRMVPGAIVRWGSYVAPQVVVMPSFINTGAYVGQGTMVDTGARVGSCAQIGKNCHISGGAGIGGVLEPAQAQPVIIEDNCFIGALSEIVEGVQVGEGAVIGMGVTIGASTKIIDRETGGVSYGRVPPYAVVVHGSLATAENPLLSVGCAVIVKKVDAQTRAKVGINDLLRL